MSEPSGDSPSQGQRLLSTTSSSYGAVPGMGKETTFTSSFGTKRFIAIFIMGILLAALLSGLITYFITRNANTPFNPDNPNDRQTSIPDSSSSPALPSEQLRLPKTLRPESYRFNFKIYMPGYGATFPKDRNLTYDGEVSMKVKVLGSTTQIVINYKNQTFEGNDAFTVERENDGQKVTIPVKGHYLEESKEKLTIDLGEMLREGEDVYITIRFIGNVQEGTLAGLYLSKYADRDGKPKIMLVTQMEPSDARMFVPCFDEPEYKATWEMSIEHPEGTVALSNGLENTPTATTPGWLMTTYKKTPKMSSYLLAAAIGEFEYVEKRTPSGVLVRVWSRPEMKNYTVYAAEAGAKVLSVYEGFYAIKFPLEKMDMLACPDFAAGAMENWGLVTYRETALLYNPAVSDMNMKQRVAVVIAHELAHQWFGNLVTMEWWTDLWLNEGFATFVEFIGTDAISDGNYKMEEEFVGDAQLSALTADALPTSQPLSFKIDIAQEASEAFNVISYEKGGSFLTMTQTVMGKEAFVDGIQLYLKKHQYDNAKAADLYEALQESAVKHQLKGINGNQLDVPFFAEQWTTQMGFPLLSVSRMNTSHVVLTQSRFKSTNSTPDRKKYANPKYGFKWDIPVWYKEGVNGETKIAWLQRDSTLSLPSSTETPLILNVDSYGFYRVDYGKEGWTAVKEILHKDFTKLSVRTRARIIGDAFALAEVGSMKYVELFDLLSYINKETEYLPWSSFLLGFSQIASRMDGEPAEMDIKRYKRDLLHELYAKTSVDELASTYTHDEVHRKNLLSSTIISQVCKADNPACVSEAVKSFQDHFLAVCNSKDSVASQCSKITPPLRATFYCLGVRYGLPGTFDNMWEMFKRENDQFELRRLMQGVTCTSDIASLKSILISALHPKTSPIRLQDAGMLYTFAAKNPLMRPFLAPFFFEHWKEIHTTFKDNDSILRSIIQGSLSGVCTSQQIKELVDWRNAHPETLSLQVFNTIITNAYQNMDWVKAHGDEISSYFAHKA